MLLRQMVVAVLVPAVAILVLACGSTMDDGPQAPAEPTPAAAEAVASPSPVVEAAPVELELVSFQVQRGSRPHDVAPAPDGRVWWTAQGIGALGVLDPRTGESRLIPLGPGSAPHGVIVGPDGAPWITNGGSANSIVRVDPVTEEVRSFALPSNRANANLNTAAFDGNGVLWFTGQSGIYGRLNPATGAMQVFDAPRGRGPYGITATPSGDIYFCSLAGSYIAKIDTATGEATVIEPPTPNQGARRVWSDSRGRIWVSEWNSGQVSVYDPATNAWQEWMLPGARPQTYAVYVDEDDMVWLSDFGANTMVRFNPGTEEFTSFELTGPNAAVRQILGRGGEIWGAESGTERIIVIRAKS